MRQITSTTQQIGSLFRLRFQLKSFNGASFADVPGVYALSTPVEVFSHTHYLNNKKKGFKPAPPTISDIVPSVVRVQGGCKLVVLGSNFIKVGCFVLFSVSFPHHRILSVRNSR